MKKPSLLIMLFLVMVAFACTNNEEDLLTAPGTEDPIEQISYADQIQPIFNTSCGGSGCHTSGGAASGVNLASYAQAVASTGNLYNERVIQAGNADGSPLVDKLEPNPTHGSRMPLGRSALSNTQIQTIRTWIDEGARDN